MRIKRIGTDREDQGNDFIEEQITFHVDVPDGNVVIEGNVISLRVGDSDAADD